MISGFSLCIKFRSFGYEVIIFGLSMDLDNLVGFNKLEAVLGCFTATDFISPLFDALWICLLLLFKNSSVFFSFSSVRYLLLS